MVVLRKSKVHADKSQYFCVPLTTICVGSLLDKTLRMEMDNPIFHRLQDAVEHPCRSKEWFGMAEQAINTIYALGEHPDTLCNDLIKKLTIRAFSRKERANPDHEPERDPDAMDQGPDDTRDDGGTSREGSQEDQDKDMGDAFELSQLLFVVGHVAIKHIVFLELVEREWKRQKDEKQAGNCDDKIPPPPFKTARSFKEDKERGGS